MVEQERRVEQRTIATVSGIRMLRTPYNGHSGESKRLVRTAYFSNVGRRIAIFAVKRDLTDRHYGDVNVNCGLMQYSAALADRSV